jgi:LacI family transcriptional regulator
MVGSRRVTLHEVAARAGVSATTVSYILNGRSDQMRISETTQQRVRQAALDLDYRPNPSARSLRTRSTRTVGLVSDLLAGGQFASQMITGANLSARGQDHFILVGESQGDPDLEALLVQALIDQHVDGIVYARVITTDLTLPPILATSRTVQLNCFDVSAAAPAVVPDDYQGGRAAVDALLAGGIRDGVHLVGSAPAAGGTARGLRLDGIRDALASARTALVTEVGCDWSVPAAYAATVEFLESGGRPRGLICMNDRIAMGVYQALAECRLRVPDDVSVVSFDGSELAGWLRPRLTSVTLPYAAMGARAVDLLLSTEIEAPRVVRVPMTVSHGLSVREPG